MTSESWKPMDSDVAMKSNCNAKLLLSLCGEAGIADAQVRQHGGIVRFASIASLVSTERACAWTLGGVLDDHQFEQLSREADQAFQPFASPNSDIAFAMPALIVTARNS
jgi:hypothetical protein